MKVDDKDLELSNKFKNYQFVLDMQKQNKVLDFKKNHSDTVEAGIIVEHNIDYFKNKFKDYPLLKRRPALVLELKERFPNLNEKALSKVLRKKGFYTESFVAVFSSVLYGIVNGLISLVYLIMGASISVSYIILSFVVFLLLYLNLISILNNQAIPSYRIRK